MKQMYNPPHPGKVLKHTVLREMTVTEFAKRLSIARVTLSRVVNGRATVSAELAIRFAAALGGSAETWMRMQMAYELWHAQKKRRPRIRRIELRQVARETQTFVSLPACSAGGGVQTQMDAASNPSRKKVIEPVRRSFKAGRGAILDELGASPVKGRKWGMKRAHGIDLTSSSVR